MTRFSFLNFLHALPGPGRKRPVRALAGKSPVNRATLSGRLTGSRQPRLRGLWAEGRRRVVYGPDRVVRNFFAAAALLGLLCVPAARAQNPALPPAADSNTGIVVQGSGEVNVRPDLARISLGVQNQATDSTAAAQTNTDRTAKVIEAMKRAGVAERDIQTSNYSIYLQYDSRPKPGQSGLSEQVVAGYQVSNTVRVTVRKIADAGRVLDAAVKAGANVAQGIQFDLDVPTAAKARADALRAAVTDALSKARVIADAAGVKQIVLVAIIENGAQGIIRPVYEGMAMMKSADAATPVQPGENT